MAGQGAVTRDRADGRIARWQVRWTEVRTICAVTVRDGSGAADPGALRVQVSGDGATWATVSAPEAIEAESDGPHGTVFTFRAGYPLPAHHLRIEPATGAALDLGAVAVYGEPLEPEIGLPDELMRSLLALRGRAGRRRGLSGLLHGAGERIRALLAYGSTRRAGRDG